jgi:transposase
MLLKDIRDYDGIYLHVGPIDFRRAIDGLAHIVKQELRMDPFGNYLFLFCNKNRNRLKALAWENIGFSMYYKRLDGVGAKFIWPNTADALRNVSVEQLRLLLSGLSIDPPRGFSEVTARDF